MSDSNDRDRYGSPMFPPSKEPTFQYPSPPREKSQSRHMNYQISPRVLQAINECNRDSLYYRVFPLGIASYAYVFYRQSMAPSSPQKLAIRLAVATVGSILAGKLSYAKACRQKIDAILQMEKNSDSPSSQSLPPPSPALPDAGSSGVSPFPTDDSWAPTNYYSLPPPAFPEDNFPKSNEPQTNPKIRQYNSYTELRERSRAAAESDQRQQHNSPTRPQDPQIQRDQLNPPPQSSKDEWNQRR